MTMREIQDLTLQLDRGLASIERRFQERAEAIRQWKRPDALILRATAIPLEPLEVPGVPGNEQLYPDIARIAGIFGSGGRALAQFPAHIGRWRPILRGVRAASNDPNDSHGCHIELHRDGLVEFVFAVEDEKTLKVFLAWFMALVCSALIGIEKARQAAGASAVEYGLDLAIHCRLRPLPVGGWHDGPFMSFGPVDPPGFALPRYSVGDRSSFQGLIDLIQQDFWNAAGVNIPEDQLFKVDVG